MMPLGGARTGPLAIDGGRPVRDARRTRWSDPSGPGPWEWVRHVRPRMGSVFLGGQEGLPGARAAEFNRAWADYCGSRHSLLVGHGTDALRLSLAAVLDHDGLDYGGEVIVPNLSFIASATAALDRRIGVALVDVDPDTLLLDPARVEEAIVPGRTRGIVPVHLFGQPADMTALTDIAERHGLALIEDAAQAHGAEWEDRSVGTFGSAGAFSFQSSKVLNSGEGGAIVTDDEDVLDRAYSLHNVGRDRAGPDRWAHLGLGWNCRATEYQATLLLHRLARLDAQQRRRAEGFATLRSRLSEGSGLADGGCLRPLEVHASVTRHGLYMFAMRYDAERCGGTTVDAFVAAMQAEGIPLYHGFRSTIADQPAIRTLAERRPDYFRLLDTPVADAAVRDLVYLPDHVLFGSERDLEDVVSAMSKIVRARA